MPSKKERQLAFLSYQPCRSLSRETQNNHFVSLHQVGNPNADHGQSECAAARLEGGDIKHFSVLNQTESEESAIRF
jgi:hypothetical protein